MTEKRFTKQEVYDGISEHIQFYDENKRISYDTVEEVLNALHEENTRLKAYLLRYTDLDCDDIEGICKDEILSEWGSGLFD